MKRTPQQKVEAFAYGSRLGARLMIERAHLPPKELHHTQRNESKKINNSPCAAYAVS